MALEVLEKEKWKMKAAWRSGFKKGTEVGKRIRAFLRKSERHTKQRTREKRAHGRIGKRRGSLDPRVGLGLAATFITAFIAIMVVAIIQPTVDQNIPANSTLRPAYDTFTDYVGKSFDMWGLAIFVSVLGLVVGSIYSFWRG